MKPKGWRGESRRHSMARKGIGTADGKRKPKEDWRSDEWKEYVNRKIQKAIDMDMKIIGVDAFYESSVGFYGMAKSERGFRQKVGKDDMMEHADEIDWNRGALRMLDVSMIGW